MSELPEWMKLWVKIAELKGWTQLHPYHNSYREGFVGLEGCSPEKPLHENGMRNIVDVPKWPRDMTAAWELVEEMQEWGKNIEDPDDRMFFALHGPDPRITYECPGLNKWIAGMARDYDYEGITISTWAVGSTAPEAICRAYLAWKEANP